MDKLPITSFAYGPLKFDIERANVTIGRLKCRGSKKVKTESITCSSLKRERHYDSGYYTLKSKLEPPKLGYCDMNNIDYTEDENSTPTLGNKIQYLGIQKCNN